MPLDDLLRKKLVEEEKLPEARQAIHIPIYELKAVLRQKLTEKEEGVSIKRKDGNKLAEKLTQISFMYRRTVLAVKKAEKDQNP